MLYINVKFNEILFRTETLFDLWTLGKRTLTLTMAYQLIIINLCMMKLN